MFDETDALQSLFAGNSNFQPGSRFFADSSVIGYFHNSLPLSVCQSVHPSVCL